MKPCNLLKPAVTGMVILGLVLSLVLIPTGPGRAGSLRADSCAWQSSAGSWYGNWSDASHWDCGHVPGSDDSAAIGWGEATLDSNVTVQGLSLAADLAASGSYTLTITGSFYWQSGNLRSGGLKLHLAPGSTTTLNQNLNTYIDGATLDNYGDFTLDHTQGISYQYGGGGTINNYGNFTIASGGTTPEGPSFINGQSFHNASGGTLGIDVGTGNRVQINGPFDNAGSLSVQSGSLELSQGGTHSGEIWLASAGGLILDGLQAFYLNDGTSFSGNGWLGWGGAYLEIDTDILLSNMHVGYGEIDGHGHSLTVLSNFHWDQGTLYNLELNISSGADAIADNNGSQTYLDGGATIQNAGNFTIAHPEGIAFAGSGGTVSNTGTFTLSSGGFAGNAFENYGLLVANPPPAGSVSLSAPLSNHGDVNVFSGTLALNGDFVQEEGSTTLSGARMRFSGDFIQNGGITLLNDARIEGVPPSAEIALNEGCIQGNGVITASINQVGGVVAPGNMLGLLEIHGDYNLSENGMVGINLGGPLPITGYDVLRVSGVANVQGGALELQTVNGFEPLPGDVFQVMEYGSHSGELNLSGGSLVLSPTYTAHALLISIESIKLEQSILFDPLPDRTFGEAPFVITATASSGLPVSFVAFSGTCRVDGNGVTLLSAGPCTIEAQQPGNDDYFPATAVAQEFEIHPATQAITFAPLPDQFFGAEPFVISATASSALTVTLTTTASTACSLDGNVVTLLSAGRCAITAHQGGNGNYTPAPNVTRTFMVYHRLLLPLVLQNHE